MGQAKNRKKNIAETLAAFASFSKKEPTPKMPTAFLRDFFDFLADRHSWVLSAYEQALFHDDPDVQNGLKTVMNDVIEEGFEDGRGFNFGIVCDLDYPVSDALMEYDDTEGVVLSLANTLDVPKEAIHVSISNILFPSDRDGLEDVVLAVYNFFQCRPAEHEKFRNTRLGDDHSVMTERRILLVHIDASHADSIREKIETGLPIPLERTRAAYELDDESGGCRIRTPIVPLRVISAWDCFVESPFIEAERRAESDLNAAPAKSNAYFDLSAPDEKDPENLELLLSLGDTDPDCETPMTVLGSGTTEDMLYLFDRIRRFLFASGKVGATYLSSFEGFLQVPDDAVIERS